MTPDLTPAHVCASPARPVELEGHPHDDLKARTNSRHRTLAAASAAFAHPPAPAPALHARPESRPALAPPPDPAPALGPGPLARLERAPAMHTSGQRERRGVAAGVRVPVVRGYRNKQRYGSVAVWLQNSCGMAAIWLK